MSPPRVVALAGGAVGVAMLDVLRDHAIRPVGVVVSHAGGGSGRPCPFTVAWCERNAVDHVYFPRLRDTPEPEAWLRARTPELLLSLSYDLILPAELLALAPRAVNVHRGIAPDFRGAYSTIWALARGAHEVGVTVHAMVPDVDAGPILAQRRLPVTAETTAAEAIPLVERAAVELVDEVIDDLVADRLPARPQPPGGEVFGRELPDGELAGAEALLRARFNPPYPGLHVRLGDRRFELTETPPSVADDPPLSATPRFVAPARWHNARDFARGRPAVWTADAGRAAALALTGPVAVPQLMSHALAAAIHGLDVATYALGPEYDPEPSSLLAAAPGRTVVLQWICGRPPSARIRRLAAEHGARVVEDRTSALLNRDPIEGTAVLDLATWTGSRDGAGLVHDGSSDATDSISPDGAREALTAFDAATARTRMERAAARYMAALAPIAALRSWPPGTVAHGFPIVVHDAALRERVDAALPGLVTRPLTGHDHAEALLVLPCHAGVTDAHVDTVVAALRDVGALA